MMPSPLGWTAPQCSAIGVACLLAIARPHCCELCMYRHHVRSCWQRGIDKHPRQSSWSAAPAERVNVASEVVRRQLWSWLSVEARPVLAWAKINALPCLAQVRWKDALIPPLTV